MQAGKTITGKVHDEAPVPTTTPQHARAREESGRPWPLFLIASPAAVAVWSGWVGLGGLCGFGVIHPLPGIWDTLRLNTAITLPIGVEAYGAYALGAWLAPGSPRRGADVRPPVRDRCAGSGPGQVMYHLLAAAGKTRAPGRGDPGVVPAGGHAVVRCRANALDEGRHEGRGGSRSRGGTGGQGSRCECRREGRCECRGEGRPQCRTECRRECRDSAIRRSADQCRLQCRRQYRLRCRARRSPGSTRPPRPNARGPTTASR